MSDLAQAWRWFWSRPAAERTRLLRMTLRSWRADGTATTWRHIRRSGMYAGERITEADRYRAWCARHTPTAADLARMAADARGFPYQPLLTIVTPVYNTDAVWLDACAESVTAQAYPHWQWCIGNDGSTKPETLAALDRIAARDRRIIVQHAAKNAGISAATNLALSRAEGDYVGLMDSDDALLPHALFRVAEHLNRPGPRPDVIYTDEDKLELDGTRCEAYFKPDWSPDLFLSNMFVCHFLVARRSLIHEVGGFRTGFDFSQDYDLMLRLMEKANRVDHVTDIVYHWRRVPLSGATVGTAKPKAHVAGAAALQDYLDRNGIPGSVSDGGPPGFYRVHYQLRGTPLVTIVSPGIDRGALRARTSYGHLEFVDRVEQATGVHVLLLDPALVPQDGAWLEAMLQLSQRPDVGAVGAKLIGPDGRLAHTGWVLGVTGVAGSPFTGARGDHVGYFGSGIAIRNCSAVSAACLMTTRERLTAVGGLDGTLGPEARAIDYCLRTADAGARVLWTPWARLAFGAPRPGGSPISDRDAAELRRRWGGGIDRDPYLNPNLSRAHLDCRVAV